MISAGKCLNLVSQNVQTDNNRSSENRILEQNQKESEESSLLYLKAPNETAVFQKYQALAQIYQYLEDVTHTNPELCSLETIGKSSEGRAMRIIKIGYSNSSNSATKPIVWIDAGIHAREWIAPATAMYIVHKVRYFLSLLSNGLQWFLLFTRRPAG